MSTSSDGVFEKVRCNKADSLIHNFSPKILTKKEIELLLFSLNLCKSKSGCPF